MAMGHQRKEGLPQFGQGVAWVSERGDQKSWLTGFRRCFPGREEPSREGERHAGKGTEAASTRNPKS